MRPYAELLEFNQPNPIRLEGFTRIRDQFEGLKSQVNMVPIGGSLATDVLYDPERIMEFAGSWDYGEGNALKLGTRDGSIIQRWLKSGEESMIEMGHATFFFECSRVVTHELVRHRIASYQQESQRFTSYKGQRPNKMFYLPEELEGKDGIYYSANDAIDFGDPDMGALFVEIPDTGFEGLSATEAVESWYSEAMTLYEELLKAGVPKQIARYVLPNATRTRIIVSANTREWRHIFRLRLDKSAQPEMRELMQQAYDQLVMVFPQSLDGLLDNGRGVR